MNLHEFKVLALRTEARPNRLSVPLDLLFPSLRLFVASSNILDQVKKNTYYGSDFDLPKYKHTLKQLIDEISSLSKTLDHLDLEYPDPSALQKTDLVSNVRAVHAMLGCCTEAGELGQALLSYIETGHLDVVNVTEEMIGDIGWYSAIFIDEYNIDPYQPLENVINKLKQRYPDKFSQESAENRNLETERIILSKNIE